MSPRRRNPVSSLSSNEGTTCTSNSTSTTDSMMIEHELHRNKSDDNNNNNNNNHNHHADTCNGIDNDSNSNSNSNSNNTNTGDHENCSSSSSEEMVPMASVSGTTRIGISRRNLFFLVLVFTGLIVIASSYFNWMNLNLHELTQQYGLSSVVLDEDKAHYEEARKAYFKDTLHHHPLYTTTNNTQNHRPTGPSGPFIVQPHSEFLPHIVWLASFPNSGTSYTMTMVAQSSNKSFATNYGNEVTPPEAPNSLSIYPRRPEGPFWPGLSGIKTPRPLPDKYVITKTHCGSRCANCGPDEYIETPETFLQKCAVGHAWLTPAKQRRKYKYDVKYPPQDRVQKVIHLYRNPLHNIIARYHLILRNHGPGYSNNTAWSATHANNAVGLHLYCRDFDVKYRSQDLKFWGSQQYIPTAPCHGEFYKWTQWHNMIHEAIDLLHSTVTDDEDNDEEEETPTGETKKLTPIPIHTLYYEDYNGSKLNTTAQGILEFLELTQVSPFRDFQSRSDYDHFFTKQERKDIHELIQFVANNRTWADIQDRHYF